MTAADEWNALDPRWLPETAAVPQRVAAATLVGISEAAAVDVELWRVSGRRLRSTDSERLVAMVADSAFRVLVIVAVRWRGAWSLRFEIFEEPPVVPRRRRAGPPLVVPAELAPAIGAALLKFRALYRQHDSQQVRGAA